MNEYQEQYVKNQDGSFDLKKLLNNVLRIWYWFVFSVCIAYAIAWWVNRYTVPQYSVSSTLIINEEKKSTAELLVSVIDRYSPRKNIDNEIAILKSYRLASKTLQYLDFGISYYAVGRIKESQMYPNPPFIVTPDTSKQNSYGTKVYVEFLSNNQCKLSVENVFDQTITTGEKFEHPMFSFTITNREPLANLTGKKYFFVINNPHGLVNRYKGKLAVASNDKRGSVLSLSLSGTVPQQEVDYLNTLMDVYIQSGLDEKNQTSINAIDFIDSQLRIVTDSLQRAEDLLQDFRVSNKSFDFSKEGGVILDRLTTLQSEKQAINMQLNYYEYLQKYITTKTELNQVVAPSIVGISDPLLNGLVDNLVSLSNDKIRLSSGGSDQNPVIKNIELQIQTILTTLKENVTQLVASADIAMQDVNTRINQVEKELLKLPAVERQLMNIERNFDLNNETYTFLLKKRADAAISKASNVADNKVLDYAMSQNAAQIAPKKGRNTMSAVLLGVLIPLAFIFLLDFFNTKINDIQDIKNSTTIPIIGTIGHNKTDSEVPVAENPGSPLSESFRALRTNLHYILRDGSKKTINVTSTVSGEGKTFISINLATIIAHSGKKVLLMGLDLRKPKVNKIFNVDNSEGISTYLIGDSSYENIIQSTNIQNLYIAPAGPTPPNPAELIETPEMNKLMEQAEKDFDFVIIDTTPVAIVVDSLLLARFADVTIFVLRQDYSSKDSLLLAEELRKRQDIKNLSLVINDVSYSASYYFGNKYRYDYGYGYGYGNYEKNNYYTSDDGPKKRWRFFK